MRVQSGSGWVSRLDTHKLKKKFQSLPPTSLSFTGITIENLEFILFLTMFNRISSFLCRMMLPSLPLRILIYLNRIRFLAKKIHQNKQGLIKRCTLALLLLVCAHMHIKKPSICQKRRGKSKKSLINFFFFTLKTLFTFIHIFSGIKIRFWSI